MHTVRNLLISHALALHVKQVTGYITAATHISVRHGDNELTINVISALDADSIGVVAPKLILSSRTFVIVVFIRVFVRAEAILTILVASLPPEPASSSPFHLLGSAALIRPLEVHDCGVFEILAASDSWHCIIHLTCAIFLIRAVNGVAIEQSLLHSDSSFLDLIKILIILAGGEL